jgi:hypothetical protein
MKKTDKIESGQLEIENEILREDIKELNKVLNALKKGVLSEERVKREIIKIAGLRPKNYQWAVKRDKGSRNAVVPSVMVSDIHYGECIDPAQIMGVNEYNLSIADHRINTFAKNTVSLLRDTISLEYPGIHVALNGDLLSGNIHEELSATNEVDVMPAFIGLFDNLYSMISMFRKEFGRVLITATAGGNHSRTTRKVPAKGKAYSNYDWLMSKMLEKAFQSDKNVTFLISDGDDIQFQIYDHTYRQTHGDAFRGGQGFIGPFAPITRSETKKRTAAATYNLPYKTLIIGHFHTLMFMGNTIVNGSMVGYNEFAMKINAPYAPPIQALWLNHYRYGITGQYPIFCDTVEEKEYKSVLAWKK